MEQPLSPIHNHRHNLEPFRDEGRLKVLRQWLNIIFMVGAAAGMAIFALGHRITGLYVMIGASVFKFVELTLRMLKL